MDKKIIFAVAGSGKTTYILNRLCLQKRALIITYSINNLENLKSRIIDKWGYLPNNIKPISYFTFIYNYCYKPFLSHSIRANGINWQANPSKTLRMENPHYFVDKSNRLYSNRIARLFKFHNIEHLIVERLEKYFDVVYIDEVQDFGGHDFNFLKNFANTKVDLLFVGDFFQHTYDTSHDRNVNGTLHDDYIKYRKQFEKMGFTVDTNALMGSHRCDPGICSFITENLGIQIKSNRVGTSKVHVFNDPEIATILFKHNSIVKLFYAERHKYPCFGKNWGESKGEDRYNNVCLVMNNKTWNKFLSYDLQSLPSLTKNKLYVACSRAKRHLFIVPESLMKKFKKI